MSLIRAREFVLAAYHDLPNVLFIGSLILGSLTGYLSLVWVAMGMILTAAVVAIFQGTLNLLFPTWAQVVVPSGSIACEILGGMRGISGAKETIVAPSMWLAITLFFAVFLIYNSFRVALRDSESSVSKEKTDNRRAFSVSTIVIGFVFMALIAGRAFTGCETWLGMGLGALIGGGSAVGFWHLLDACNAGIIPDILQVVGNMAPAAVADQTPVVCTAPPVQN